MKKKNLTLPLIIASVLFFVVTAFASLNNDSLSKISLSEKEIPEGFVFGKIPPFAKKVLKNNPWTLDKPAIRKLTDRIYPGGNYNNITAIHMTIMAKKKTPYGDDIVCYLILFKEGKSATDEIEKITTFTGYNRDRALLIMKDNLAVFLHVDDTDDFHYIQDIAESFKSKLQLI